jgi:hypothetical protein
MSTPNTQPDRPKIRLILHSTINGLPIYTPENSSLKDDAEDENLHPHLRYERNQAPCDHCLYFKGIFYRVLSQSNASPAENKKLASPPPAHPSEPPAPKAPPRSLASIATEEEILKLSQHSHYLQWRTTFLASAPLNLDLAKKSKREYGAVLPSTALTTKLNSMSK